MAHIESGAYVLGSTIQPGSITAAQLSDDVVDDFLQVSNNLSDLQNASTSYQNLQLGALTAPTIVSNTLTLQSSDLGSIVQVNNNAATSVILPSGTVGFIQIRWVGGGLGSGAICTLSADSGQTINGQSSILLGVGDWLSLLSDGTAWYIQDYFMQPANCYVKSTAPQSIPAGVATVVALDTEAFDVGSYFNVSTNQYTPKLPGKYTFCASAGINTTGATAVATFEVAIYKNSTLLHEDKQSNLLVGTSTILSSDVLVDMNGSTDVITVVVIQSSTTNPALNLVAGCNFSATRTSLF